MEAEKCAAGVDLHFGFVAEEGVFEGGAVVGGVEAEGGEELVSGVLALSDFEKGIGVVLAKGWAGGQDGDGLTKRTYCGWIVLCFQGFVGGIGGCFGGLDGLRGGVGRDTGWIGADRRTSGLGRTRSRRLWLTKRTYLCV